MARSRNIKPGFFTNEDLVELDFATRLLFAGLWTVADRDGRLQDRPKKIKIDVFPADNLDIDAMLSALHNAKFITRYEVEGAKYIQIHNWAKHQNPHHTEKASEIPDANGCLTVKAPLAPKQSQKPDGEYLADSLLLIPDSLIPDSLKGEGGASDVGETPPTAVAPTPPFLIEYQKVIEANRPDLTATAPQVWALFCEQYPPEKRGIARWTKWVAEEKKPPQSLQLVTTPAKPGIDPTLAALLKESASGIVKPPNAEIRAKLAQLSGARK